MDAPEQNGVQQMTNLYGPRLTQGQKVRFNGKTNILNDKVYTGHIGTVDFQFEERVYVFMRLPGQRKDRSVSFHREALEAMESEQHTPGPRALVEAISMVAHYRQQASDAYKRAYGLHPNLSTAREYERLARVWQRDVDSLKVAA